MRLIPLKEQPHVCAYLPDREAWEESYLLLEASEDERELLMRSGYRSFGKYYFRPKCVGCKRCVPLRVPVDLFTPTKSQRRVFNRCQEINVMIDKPHYTSEKFEIYLDHSKRFPQKKNQDDEENFVLSFYDTTFPSLEFCYYLEGKLIAVGYVNVTKHALSSVYFTYLLEYSKLSLGVYSVLTEISHARQLGKHHLYLGYYVEKNHFMAYKASYFPNEILTETSQWVPFHDRRGSCLIEDSPEFSRFRVINPEEEV